MGAISTRAIRWVLNHHGHTNKETRVSVIRLVVIVVSETTEARKMSMSTKSCANWQGEPSMAKNSSPSRAPKTGAQLRDNRRSAKNDAKSVKIPLIAAITKNAESIVPVCVAQLECPQMARCTESEAPLLLMRHPPCRCVITATSITAKTAPVAPPRTSRSQQRACHHRVRELQLRNFQFSVRKPTTCTTTG